MEEFNSADVLKKQDRKRGFAVLEVGLFEISFVLIIIIVLFGVLNYFNILSLSTLYPNQLGFLPHQQTANKQSPNASRSTPKPKVIPKPSPTFPGYNWKYAQTTLEKFLRDNIYTEFLPVQIQGKQGQIAAADQTGMEYEYGARWVTNNNDFVVGFFNYGLKTNIESDVELLIQPQNIKDTIATDSLTKMLTKKYLKNVPDNAVFTCKTFSDNKTTYCGNMYDTPLGKKGYGLGISPKHNLVLVISCFVPKNGIYYDKWTSCAAF
jgi:hypothetical protein